MSKKNKHKRLPPLFVIRATGAVRNFIVKLGTRMFPPDYVMMEIASSLWVAKAVSVATGLGIADILSEGPLHISELARRTGTHEPSLMRLMRLLSGNGVFRHEGKQFYANTKLSEVLREDSHSMKYYMQHHVGGDIWAFLGDMERCVKTGDNAIKMQTGLEPFAYLEKHPEQNEVFSRAMTDSSGMAAPLFISAFPFGKYKKIIDVGGGHGILLSAIAARHAGVECIVYDLPHVAPDAVRNFISFGVEDRCSFSEGDFFEQIPSGGDLYILKNVLHDWDDEKCIAILINAARAMHDKSRLLVIDALLNDKNRNDFSKLLDMQMLVGTSGGRERSLAGFRELFTKAGLCLTRAINTATPFYMIEGRLKRK